MEPTPETTILSQYSELKHLPLTTGWNLYQTKSRFNGYLSTGISELDQYLGGHGFKLGELYELSGLPDVGKKTILYRTTQTTIQESHHVIWLDASLGLSPHKLAFGLTPSQQENSIRIWRCPALHQFFRVLQTISTSLESQVVNQDPFWKSLKLIILDSIHSYLAPIVGDSLDQWYYLAAQCCQQLKYFCYYHHLTVVITNSASRWQNSVRPSLGHFWKFFPDHQLLLEKVTFEDDEENKNEDVRKLSCIKSISNMPQSLKWVLEP